MCTDNYYSVLASEDKDKDDNKFYEIKTELANVRAGIRGRHDHTSEFKPLNYKQTMLSEDKEGWVKEIKKENQ